MENIKKYTFDSYHPNSNQDINASKPKLIIQINHQADFFSSFLKIWFKYIKELKEKKNICIKSFLNKVFKYDYLVILYN